MAVVAQVRRDERERRACGRVQQVGGEARLAPQRGGRHRAARRAERDDVLVAVGRFVDHRVEVHERVVARGVAVAGLGFLRFVGAVQRRVPAGRRLAVGVVAHVLLVGLPAPARGRQLGADVLDFGRVHAAGPGLDAAFADVAPPTKSLKIWQSRLVLDVRRLAGDERDVVVVALVAGRVVVLEQRALRGQRLRQVGVRGGVAERRFVALVLEHDHEHVLDLRQLERPRGPPQPARKRRRRAARERASAVAASARLTSPPRVPTGSRRFGDAAGRFQERRVARGRGSPSRSSRWRRGR